MRKKHRSFLLMALISASLLVSVFTIVQAQSPAAPAAKATNWSDPATWPNREVPVAGQRSAVQRGAGGERNGLSSHYGSLEYRVRSESGRTSDLPNDVGGLGAAGQDNQLTRRGGKGGRNLENENSICVAPGSVCGKSSETGTGAAQPHRQSFYATHPIDARLSLHFAAGGSWSVGIPTRE